MPTVGEQQQQQQQPTTPTLSSTNPANPPTPQNNVNNNNNNNAAGSNGVDSGNGLRKFASMDFSLAWNGTGDDEYFTSGYYEWSASFYSRPLITMRKEDDVTAPISLERKWRTTRNERILQEVWECRENCTNWTIKYRFWIMVRPWHLCYCYFHPFENLLVVADDEDEITVWNWEEGQKMRVFSRLRS